MQIAIENVTPEKAAHWLATPSERQRKVTESYVAKLAQQLRDGLFTQSPQPFIFDTDGSLLDGQHRARAIVASGVTLESATVVTGVDVGMFDKIDSGLKRQASQFVHAKYSSMLTSAARYIIVAREDPNVRDMHGRMNAVPIGDVVRLVEETEMMQLLAQPCSTAYGACGINKSALLAVSTLGAEQNADLLDAWFQGITIGADLRVGDPRLALRNAWTSRRAELNSSAATRMRWTFIVKAWNAFVEDRDVRLLRYSRTEDVPAVL